MFNGMRQEKSEPGASLRDYEGRSRRGKKRPARPGERTIFERAPKRGLGEEAVGRVNQYKYACNRVATPLGKWGEERSCSVSACQRRIAQKDTPKNVSQTSVKIGISQRGKQALRKASPLPPVADGTPVPPRSISSVRGPCGEKPNLKKINAARIELNSRVCAEKSFWSTKVRHQGAGEIGNHRINSLRGRLGKLVSNT